MSDTTAHTVAGSAGKRASTSTVGESRYNTCVTSGWAARRAR